MNNFIKSVDVPEHLDLLKDFENEGLENNTLVLDIPPQNFSSSQIENYVDTSSISPNGIYHSN